MFNSFRRKPKPEQEEKKSSARAALEPFAGKPEAGKQPRAKAEAKALPVWVEKLHGTERATALQAFNQYVFRVGRRANKAELSKSIGRHYGVHVEHVRIINVPGKPRRVKGVSGWKPGYKKAIVAVRQGEKIDIGA